MRILGFDTATRATAVALCEFDDAPAGSDSEARPAGTEHRSPRAVRELEERDDPPRGARPSHAVRLMPSVVTLLERAGWTWGEIDRIAVGVGPGTFTGLRIGVATARALGQARELPVVGIGTLQSLVLNAQHQGASALPTPACDAVLAVLDARRGEVFAAAWPLEQRSGEQSVSFAAPLIPSQALTPAVLAELIPGLGSRALVIGDGAVEFRSVLKRSGALIPEDDSELHRVTAINHCRLACTMRPSAPDEVHPEYLRLPDAEIARRASGTK